jgi:hypothetical protein
MFTIMEQFYGTWGGRKGKENDKESTISKHITSVRVEDVMIYMKAIECWRIGGEG